MVETAFINLSYHRFKIATSDNANPMHIQCSWAGLYRVGFRSVLRCWINVVFSIIYNLLLSDYNLRSRYCVYICYGAVWWNFAPNWYTFVQINCDQMITHGNQATTLATAINGPSYIYPTIPGFWRHAILSSFECDLNIARPFFRNYRNSRILDTSFSGKYVYKLYQTCVFSNMNCHETWCCV